MPTTDPRQKGRTEPESRFYYSFANNGNVHPVKILGITGATSFVEETGVTPPVFYSPGVQLFVSMETTRDQSSEEQLVVTINGWEESGSAAIACTATIRPYAKKDETVTCIQALSKKFLGISSVSITGGTSGEKVMIFFLPAASTFSLLGFRPRADYGEGPEFFNVAKYWDPADHKKRQRAVNDITYTDVYQASSGRTNIVTLKGFTALILEQIYDDNKAYTKELLICSRVQIEDAPIAAPDPAGTDVVDVSVTGNFSRLFSHSAPSTTTSAAYVV